jgi:hypothetical protein
MADKQRRVKAKRGDHGADISPVLFGVRRIHGRPAMTSQVERHQPKVVTQSLDERLPHLEIVPRAMYEKRIAAASTEIPRGEPPVIRVQQQIAGRLAACCL